MSNEAGAEAKEAAPSVEQILEAEARVLFPDSHTTRVVIVGQEVDLRPLPVAFAKRVKVLCQKVNTQLAKLGKVEDKKQLIDLPEAEELDVDAIDTLMDIVVVIAGYHNVTTNRDAIENSMGVSDIVEVVRAQLSLQRDNDFLLQPLRNIITLVLLVNPVLKGLRNSLSTPPSPKPGESDSTNS